MFVRSRAARIAVAALLLGTLVLTGCAGNTGGNGGNTGGEATGTVKPVAIKIGTLATQDSLPLWVAEEKGYFAEAGLPGVEIITFQSAQECQAAFTAGSVNALMTDIIVSAKLQASGTDVVLPTVMLGADKTQGRFAVVAGPKSDVKSMADLKGVPVGVGAATITEFILDKLAEEAGLAQGDVKGEEVPKMPVRFELLMSGKLKAASLPEPFVSLAVQSGGKILEGGDDTKAAENISSVVMCVNGKFADSPEGAATVDALLKAWDRAVADINADPNAYRKTLVDKARLPAPLAESYQVSTYPTAAAPAEADVQLVLDWMKTKGYLTAEVTPADLLPKK